MAKFEIPHVKEVLETINAFSKARKLIDPDKQRLTESLAGRGWFFNDTTTPGFWLTILNLMKDGEYESVDKMFCHWYEEEKDEIFERLTTIYPSISMNLNEVKFCADNNMYYAAIPLMLTLSEYIANVNTSKLISKDTTHVLFNKERSGSIKNRLGIHFGPHIKKYDQFSYRSVITKDHSFNENQSLTDHTKVNRHAILHGCDVKYGTKINFFKTLCFLDYIDLTLRILVRRVNGKAS